MKKVVAILEADLKQSPIGTRSRLGDLLCGRSLLRHTLEWILKSRSISELFVLMPEAQISEGKRLVAGLNVQIRPVKDDPPPYRGFAARSRKWSLDGWRGGIGGTTWMDECVDVGKLLTEAESLGADAVWTCPAAAPLLDSESIDSMVDFYQERHEVTRFVFMQAPPGWSGAIFQTQLLRDLWERQKGPYWLFNYKPDFPIMDLALKECCLPTPQAIRHAHGRLIADTERSWKRVERLLAAEEAMDAERVGARLARESLEMPEPFPAEIEIELTTENRLPVSKLMPGGNDEATRGPMPLGVLESMLFSLAPYDDVRVVLGGFGEPALHPEFTKVLKTLADSSVYGIAAQTHGLGWSDESINELIANRVDVVNVSLDATMPETYARLHGADRLAEATSLVERLMKAVSDRGGDGPLVCVQFTKCRENLQEMEAFVDGWHRRGAWPVVISPSHCAGQRENLGLGSMSPTTRGPCRRIMRRAIVLADGCVTACDQDFRARHPLGRLPGQNLAEIWNGASFQALRDSHIQGRFDGMALCPSCDEWDRP